MEETRFPGYNICALFKGQLKKNIYEIYFLIGDLNKVNLCRIAKVFSQPGVADLVKNAEAGLDRGNKGQ